MACQTHTYQPVRTQSICSSPGQSIGLRDMVLVRVQAKNDFDRFEEVYRLQSHRQSSGGGSGVEAFELKQLKTDITKKLDQYQSRASQIYESNKTCDSEGRLKESYYSVLNEFEQLRARISSIEKSANEFLKSKSRLADLEFEERRKFERIKSSNPQSFKYSDKEVDVEIIGFSTYDNRHRGSRSTSITIRVTYNLQTKIFRPVNSRVYGYSDRLEGGGYLPVGAAMLDDFNNSFKLVGFSPAYTGSESRGISPNSQVDYTINFGDIPLPASKNLRIQIFKGAIGQTKDVVFSIPVVK